LHKLFKTNAVSWIGWLKIKLDQKVFELIDKAFKDGTLAKIAIENQGNTMESAKALSTKRIEITGSDLNLYIRNSSRGFLNINTWYVEELKARAISVEGYKLQGGKYVGSRTSPTGADRYGTGRSAGKIGLSDGCK
jgi:hypothetical protein